MNIDLINRVVLPKWTRMVVVGNRVSASQAAEILIRTDELDFICNDHQWQKKLYSYMNVMGNDVDSGYIVPNYEKLKHLKESLGTIDLQYLQNHQIASSNIFGPYGWCSWNGLIGCDYYIGKWPDVKTLLEEWKLIASTWPFLNLRCQFWRKQEENKIENSNSESDGDCEKNFAPMVEFVVKEGNVLLVEPKQTMCYSSGDMSIGRVFAPGGERGCSFEKFTNAIELVRKLRNIK